MTISVRHVDGDGDVCIDVYTDDDSWYVIVSPVHGMKTFDKDNNPIDFSVLPKTDAKALASIKSLRNMVREHIQYLMEEELERARDAMIDYGDLKVTYAMWGGR